MRRAARVDVNQSEIVATYRADGASVQILSTVGDGCPDLLVGKNGINYLVEAKDGNKPPSQRKLTPDQVKWHKNWQGNVHVVLSKNDALRIFD